MSGKDGGYSLPDEIDPPRIRFCVEIPDNLFHIMAFWGALTELTKWWNWQRDEAHTALLVTAVWKDVIEQARASFAAGECLDEDEFCTEYDAAEERVTFYPEIDATELPLGYLVNPWIRITGPNPLVGLKTGDVITDVVHIPPLPTIWDHLEDLGTVLSLGYPSISITGLVGRGTVRVYLLSVFLGGRALIVKDNELIGTAFLDTNLDTASVPPETYAENIIEYRFETSGEHRLDIVFVPNVSADIEFLGFGGGFRRVEICGFEENGGAMDEECCDDITTRLDEQLKRFDKIIDLLKDGFKIVPLNADEPDDFRVDCSPSDFDKNEGETDVDVLADRTTALCLMVARYILATLWRYGKPMNMSAATKADLLLLMDIDAPPDFYPQLVKGNIDTVTLTQIARIAGTGTTAFENVLCAMILGLKAESNTFARFKISLTLGDVSIYPDAETHWLTEIIVAGNQERENYNTFARELEKAYDEIVDGLVYECPCEVIEPDDCALPLDLIFKDGRGTLVELVGVDLYHFTGDPSTGPPYIGGVYLKDANNQCFELAIPPPGMTGLPIGWVQQFTEYHYVIGCCGTADHEGVGGWENGYFTEAYWDAGDTTPVDTYYIIRCKDTSEC